MLWNRRRARPSRPLRPVLETLEVRCLLSAPGDPDTEFGPNHDGRVLETAFAEAVWATGTNFLQTKRDVAIQMIGNSPKILVTGTGGSGGEFTVARYNQDGTLDTTFGTQGRIGWTSGMAQGLVQDE